jgi:hypothetical protein
LLFSSATKSASIPYSPAQRPSPSSELSPMEHLRSAREEVERLRTKATKIVKYRVGISSRHSF